MTLDPRLLRPFVVLAEELHFGRAAQRLHVTQPALSQQVKRLEGQLGVELFARTRASVELTEAGETLLAPARAAVEAADEAELMAAEFAGAERGRLRIGISPGTHELAQRVLAELRARRPGLTLEAKQDNSGVLCGDVAAGRLDVAITFEPEQLDGTVCEEISREPAVVAVAAAHPLAGRGRVALAELAGERFALVDDAGGRGYNQAVVDRCRAAGFEPTLDGDPHGPMAWETAVRTRGAVGLTTRTSAVSTAREIALVDLDPPLDFAIALVTPTAGPRPPAVLLTREIVRP
ncbi:MAG TPA: LysR family transcriptional regulator [Thermoleophilaceae bacterium]|nr:LysR family transcriptional regulator [Thermoleophilaceae bacterium]